MTDKEKIIYDILCSDEQPPKGQHWEGFVTNKIVAALAQPEPEPEKSQDKPCVEDDGCPTEKAVLQRFWREHQEQPDPEPVAWGILNTRPTEKQPLMMVMLDEPEPSHLVVPLYASPPQREWDGLTDEEIAEIGEIWLKGNRMLPFPLARAIEAKLKEKNT